MRASVYIDPERLREVFEYRDGMLFWKVKRCRRIPIGARAGSKIAGKSRYRRIHLDGKETFEHRVIFAMHHGYYPEQVDHEDRDRSNNRIENLVDSDPSANGMNRGPTVRNRTGVKNVHPTPNGKKFFAQHTVRGRATYLGTYETIDDAAAALDQTRKDMGY